MTGFLAIARTAGPLDLPALLGVARPHLEARAREPAESWSTAEVGCVSARFLAHDGDCGSVIAALPDGGRMVGQLRLDDQEALLIEEPGLEHHTGDLELLAGLLDQAGQSAASRLYGDYSVATVHPAPGPVSLRAWRDPLGVRLLFFTRTERFVAVSNTLRALLSLPGVRRELDRPVVEEWLRSGYPRQRRRTWFADIQRVLPGETLTLHRDGRFSLEGRWTLPARGTSHVLKASEYPARFRALLQQAVDDRLRSPRVSVLLSGGLDSTSIAALAARSAAEAGNVVHCVTNRFRTLLPNDENVFARAACDSSGAPLREVDADCLRFRDRWDEATSRVTPAGEPGLALWNELLRTAAQHGPAALTGYDGDSLLDPPDLRGLLAEETLPRLALAAVRYMWTHHRRPVLALRRLVRAPDTHAPEWPWLRPRSGAHAHDHAGTTLLPRHSRAAMCDSLTSPAWEHLFEQCDAGFSGIPLEVRFPLLDRRLVEFVLQAPAIPWCQHKYLLRESMRDILPDAVRLRPKTTFPGFIEARLAQFCAVAPRWDPGAALHGSLEGFVDGARLPHSLDPDNPEAALALLRVAELSDWMHAND